MPVLDNSSNVFDSGYRFVGEGQQHTVYATNMTVGVVSINMRGNAVPEPMYKDGEVKELSATNKTVLINGPCEYSLSKLAGVAARVGVWYGYSAD